METLIEYANQCLGSCGFDPLTPDQERKMSLMDQDQFNEYLGILILSGNVPD